MLRPTILIAIASLAGVLVARPALAQDTTVHHGGVNGAARSVSNASKSAGRAIKKGVKSAGSSVHHVLKTAGRGTKAGVDRAIGDTIHDPNHKPGGLNKVAREASESVKHVGRTAKSAIHHGANDTHKGLQKAGNDVKKTVADSSHH
jgi:hypothetical protein